jgi:glycine/D-amino acid oxidase-like deaminating enzyme
MTGAFIAQALCAEGVNVVLLDKRDIGTGSTAASTALLQYELDVPLVELRERIGRDDADRAYLACRDAVGKLATLDASLPAATSFRMRDSLYLVARDRDLDAHRAELAARREIGLGGEWLERDDLHRRFGIDRPGAIHSPGAAEVDAYALTHALFADARTRGARVFAHTRVVDVVASNDGVTLRLAGGETVRAGHVVFATGYETRDFVGVGPAKLVSTVAIASTANAVPTLWRDSGALIWERDDPYLYLRTTSDDRVIVGGEDEDFRDPEHRDALLGAKAQRLAERYRDLFPDATLEVDFAWAGTFGETADGLPYVGAHPDWPCCQFALGYGGNGITFSALAAEIVRDVIVGRANVHADLFAFGR